MSEQHTHGTEYGYRNERQGSIVSEKRHVGREEPAADEVHNLVNMHTSNTIVELDSTAHLERMSRLGGKVKRRWHVGTSTGCLPG